ncbi:hypothetical protein HYC85_029981 [Camellia sinensis]|uniref:Transposase (putative) gypsy type domain-containing protein n=1 Tax=Camellia sinensis TaxID=4442 RepID=A0A7J7FZE5_CAMSI|nr:hypothetical protein HYC85_029981 [Camellia sinensis]
MPFPIVAFTECGLRLPLDPLFRQVLHFYKLNPMQLTINSYRDRGFVYYLKPRSTQYKIIADLPDSNKGAGDDFLIASGNWEFGPDEDVHLYPLPRTITEGKNLHQPPKNFRQSFFPGTDLKTLLGLPIHKRKAPVLLNFISTYKSTLPDVPRKRKKSLSPPTATTLTASTSRTDQESTSDPPGLPSTSAPYLIPIPERKRRRRLVKTAEMVRPRPVVQDLLADLPTDAEAAPTQSMLPPKPKRVKKAQPKAKATDAEAEDALPISKLAESKKSASTSTKRSAEGQPSGSTQTKRPRSSSATTSASKKPDVPWAPELTLEDRPIMASESADDINVGVALSTALLLPNDLERNAKLSEYENYALMLQHCVHAIQHAHSFSMQSFENRQRLVDMKREASSMKREIRALEAKMKKLEDQAEAATKIQTLALEKAEAAEAVKKVAEAEKREAEARKVQAEKELQQALATKEAEVKEADEKAYAQGMADVAEDYKLQVRQACNRGFSLGWMSLIKKLDLPADSPLRQADAIPLPFPPPPPEGESEFEADAVDEDEEKDDGDALVRKPKDAAEAKSPPPAEQVMDLTLDEEGDEVEGAPRETATGQLSSNLLLVERSVENTIAEIDAEIQAEKVADEVPPESSEVPVPAVANIEEV